MVTDEKVWRPDNLNDAWALSNRFSDQYCFVSGGTWLRTQWEAGNKKVAPQLISLDNVVELNGGIYLSDGEIVIGAFASLASVIKSTLMKKKAPLIVKACQNIAAPSIRNQATLGGNLLSRVGDAIPALLVLDAKLNWFDGEEIVTEPLEDWLISEGVSKRILVSITIREHPVVPSDMQNEFSFYLKIGRRETFIPSVVTVAGKGIYDSCADTFQKVSLVVGGGSIVPTRLKRAEVVLENQLFSKDTLQDVYTHVREEYKPIGDAFSSALYKNKVAANLIVSELYRLEVARHASK
ncbi:FAD binding domain-containing protein [Salipaludibacillus sp. HK11]|uniref:FAD binding domain-containing protein n=1 Tax=Salipaludibacillus sp. HK11 TaxID=3394320 RepID=UPI0039FC8AA3